MLACSDMAYGPHLRHTLDVHLPDTPRSAPASVHNPATPVRWIADATAPLPAFRLEHGVRDPVTGLGGDRSVPLGQTKRVATRLLEVDAIVAYHERDGLGHGLGGWYTSGLHHDAAAWLASVLHA